MERKVALFTEVWIEILPPPQETWDELSEPKLCSAPRDG